MVPQKFYRVREPKKPATSQPWAQASLRSEKAAADERLESRLSGEASSARKRHSAQHKQRIHGICKSSQNPLVFIFSIP